jgi:hypothetical protein
MNRICTLTVAVLAFAAGVRADERIVWEDFSSAATLSFGPSSVTGGRLETDPSAENPFDHFLRLPAGSELISSVALHPGPTAQGSLEDVVWMTLTGSEETEPGRRGGFLAVSFDKGGPDVRIVRVSTRPEATVEWFDGTNWQRTGAVFPLDRRYRLRTVMVLETGTMDIYLKEEPGGKEVSLVLGATFRGFSAGELGRKFALDRPTDMKVGLSGWQLWRVGQNELLREGQPESQGRLVSAVTVMRYAAPVTVDGDAVSAESAGGSMSWMLKSARGLRDDMELTDVSAWNPPQRVLRQTSFRHSGKWSLGLSEGDVPVDREVTLPATGFDLKIHFLVPKELPANRQIYLVRFKNEETGTEPVGPSVYLDYGARPDGKSLVICQIRPDQYYSWEVDVLPAVWYGLHLVSRQAAYTYTAAFIDEKGGEQPINDGKPLDFFLGTSMGERLRWRLFSIVSMRPTITDWPKVDVTRKVLDPLGPKQPAQAAAFADGKLYVVLPDLGLAVYNREFVCTEFTPRRFESITGVYHPVSAFTWDSWGQCFYLQSASARKVMKLDRNLKLMDTASAVYLDSVGLAAASDALYFVTNTGAIVKSDKFLGLRSALPLDKMFGGAPLFSAVACTDRYLYLATRKDSPLFPSQLICVDTVTWNPVFSVNLKDSFPDVTCMTTDGETMVLFGTASPDVATLKLPAKHELVPEKTFVYIDDMELSGIGGAGQGTRSGKISGAVTSRPVRLDAALRKLRYVSWEDMPYDPAKGTMRLCVRTAPDKYFIDRVSWVPVENQKTVDMPLGPYLEWRLEMSTHDPWRPPGLSGLVFGLTRTSSSASGAEEPGSGRWAWFLLAVLAAAAAAYFLVGRRSWWEGKKRSGRS